MLDERKGAVNFLPWQDAHGGWIRDFQALLARQLLLLDHIMQCAESVSAGVSIIEATVRLERDTPLCDVRATRFVAPRCISIMPQSCHSFKTNLRPSDIISGERCRDNHEVRGSAEHHGDEGIKLFKSKLLTGAFEVGIFRKTRDND